MRQSLSEDFSSISGKMKLNPKANILSLEAKTVYRKTDRTLREAS